MLGQIFFIGNLDPDVEEKLLYDTFSAFGVIATNPKIMRYPDTGNSRGFGFISCDSFEASYAAMEYLCNRQITVSYAYKKDTKGERHDTPAAIGNGPPTLPSGAQANGGMGAPVPPRPFLNGTVPPNPVPVPRPSPPQNVPYPQMLVGGQLPWQGQPQHLGHQMPPPVMPPPPMQYRPAPPNMPPPPQAMSGLSRPTSPMSMGAPHGWPQSAPPQQQMGGRPPMPQMSMPPPPPPPSGS
ncbi:calcium-binding allergen Ole e 8-like [Hibiscus syriacus]|uniref:Calcium-binding allergen Ole e 8-like n=1 Tax=Hibiscus syriacus TaxID=106335 RepID=A0A6A3BU41_HIBSY|nr:calcium-binding allergen Ole e 8-like [Hibiscus syriacus]